jgi:hypothetical protein
MVSDNYVADDSDLPEALFQPEPGKPNRIQSARARILTTAAEMGLPITSAELRRFAIILCGTEDDAEVRDAKQKVGA